MIFQCAAGMARTRVFSALGTKTALALALASRSRLVSTSCVRFNQQNDEVPIKSLVPSIHIKDSDLHPELKSHFLEQVGDTLTPVQHASIDAFLKSESGIIVRAHTGTGKTFAFGIPILHDILDNKSADAKKSIHSIIISPTRDLAIQTKGSLDKIWSKTSRKSRSPPISLLIGQAPIRSQLQNFRGPHKSQIAVCTPGRMNDLLNNYDLVRASAKDVKYIIIDEADELLTQNFEEDIANIIETCQSLKTKEDEKIKIMMFSATVSRRVFDFGERIMNAKLPYIDVVPTEQKAKDSIAQRVVETSSIIDSYAACLELILDNANNKNFKAIIFFETVAAVDNFDRIVHKFLREHNTRTRLYQLHGKLSMARRAKVQQQFRETNSGVLIASNVAARGMDFPGVTDVLQVGMTRELESYTHRIGRTGRAGSSGSAHLFLTQSELPILDPLEQQGNTFTRVTDYTPREETRKFLQSVLEPYEAESLVMNVLGSIIGSTKNNSRFDKLELVREASEFYQGLTGVEELPRLGARQATNLGINTRESRQYFDIEGQPENREFNRQSSRSGSNFRGNRNNNRGFNDRNNNRGYSNDRNNNRSYDRNNNRNNNYGGNRNTSRSDRFDGSRSSRNNNRSYGNNRGNSWE